MNWILINVVCSETSEVRLQRTAVDGPDLKEQVLYSERDFSLENVKWSVVEWGRGDTQGQIDRRAWGSFVVSMLIMQLKPAQLTQSNRSKLITPLLKILLWLPISQRIRAKLSLPFKLSACFHLITFCGWMEMNGWAGKVTQGSNYT